jgi:hypothetical protein
LTNQFVYSINHKTTDGGTGKLMTDPREAYLNMKDDLQEVLSLPFQGREEDFRDFLVGFLVVKLGYSETRALHLVKGNEHAIVMMLLEEDETRT